jgi:pre-rRNA-processing protein TSR1
VDQNVPDPMDAEQTWPTEEEITQANGIAKVDVIEFVKEQKKMRRVPKGTSAYQAAWILEDYEDGEEINSEDDDDQVMDTADHGMDKASSNEILPENASATESIAAESSEEEYEWIEMDDRAATFDALGDEENAEEYRVYI